ncbi:unnamed protein product [Mytilus edulis]|uniref:Serine protease n=1 Tax=Mytilus edulis TaxID=6550 RepID=A0A8S3TAD2_MYTED|nr:unnamed protein product [Mytilus edulis]
MQLRKSLEKQFSWFCSTNVTINILVPRANKEIVNNFAGLPIKQILYNTEAFEEAQAISEERNKHVKLFESNINFHVPGQLAEELFNNHRRLTLVCPSKVKSLYFQHLPTFRNCSCIQLYCLVKGAIPIGETHFLCELQGIPTDVIEGFPRFASKHIRLGDSVTNTKVKGTLGGFCLFYGREAFLTCAHTMMDWDVLLSTGNKHHKQSESIYFHTGEQILDETLLCGKVVNHSFTHHNPREISTDVVLIEIGNGISVSVDDYANTKGKRQLHYTDLGKIKDHLSRFNVRYLTLR